MLLIILGTFVAGLIYFAPALVATACHHPRIIRIWAINLLGFTVIGWGYAWKETVDGVHHVYGKHSPEGNLLVQRFTFNRYFVLAVIGIGLIAVSLALGVRQIRPAPAPAVPVVAAAGDCTSDQIMVRMSGSTACLTTSPDRVRVRFDDAPNTLSWDAANSPMYADKWKTAHRVAITADVDAPAAKQ